MKVNDQNKFISLIAQKTGLPLAEIEQGIRAEEFYPSGEPYEGKNLVTGLEELCKYNTDIDHLVETKPVSFDDLSKVELPTDSKELDATDEFYHSLKSTYGDDVDDNKVLPSKVEDLGDGYLIITLTLNKLWDSQTQDGLITDFIDNKPSSLIFVDTTPGKQGIKTFLIEQSTGRSMK